MEKLCQAHVAVCLALSPLRARVCVLENLLAIWNYAMQKKRRPCKCRARIWQQDVPQEEGERGKGTGDSAQEPRRVARSGFCNIKATPGQHWITLNTELWTTQAIPFDAIRFATLNDAKLNIQTTTQSAENWWKILNNKKMETALNFMEIFEF